MNKEILDFSNKQIEILNKDGCLEGIIESKKINEITAEYAFKFLKTYVGINNPYFNQLSLNNLTLVKPGIETENSIKYVYNWGGSLIQIFFLHIEKKLYFSVKMLRY